MKKALTLLVALATASSISLGAFAADDIPGTANRATTNTTTNTTNNQTPTSNVTVGTNQFFLVDSNKRVVGGDYNRLEPDTEYSFDILFNNTGAPISNATIKSAPLLTESMLNGGTLRLRTIKGSSSIQSARIKTIGRGDSAVYSLVINTRDNYGTKMNEVEYSLSVNGNTSGTFNDSSYLFEVGYQSIDDSETNIGEGGYITITNDYPVITKDQFTDIAKSVNYKTVNFEGEDGGWVFVGRVSGMGDSNFRYTYDVVPELINKFPDQEYKFLTFNAGVTFPSTGEMRIDASDISESFSQMHTYLYRNGKLTRVDASHDKIKDELVFRTNYLGSFIITDKPITDSTLLTDTTTENNTDTTGTTDTTDTTDTNQNQTGTNPSTGASSAMNAAVAMGLAALVSAGMLSRKKK